MNIGQNIFGSYDVNAADQNIHLENANHVKPTDAVSSQPEMAGLREGAVFKGEILDIAGDKVTIALENNARLPARLQGDMGLNVGDILLFSVKENNSSHIMIKPLFDSLYSAQTQTLEKILDSAGLSPTEKNFSAARELMEAGMPVDKGNLVKLLSQSMKFEGTSMQTLVALNKMNIPVTEANIAQFERYQNYSHQLTGDIANTAESMADFAKAFPAGTGGNTLVSVAEQIVDIFLPETGVPAQSEENVAGMENAEGQEAAVQGEQQAAKGEAAQVLGKEDFQGNVKAGDTLTNPAEAAKGAADGAEIAKSAADATETAKSAADSAEIEKGQPVETDQTGLSKSFLQGMEQSLQKAGLPMEQIKTIVQNSQDSGDLLKQVTQALHHLDGNEAAIRSILESVEYKKLVSDVVKNSWSLNPKSMKDPKEIDELYDKITKQNKAFEEAVTAKGGDAKEFNQSSQNMRQNMQFMENLNQQMIYAQMPLKLSNQNANSELYVYADKRKLAEKKDGISVMLHLDMDHLGTTDIKVTLTGSNVHARFYLNDRESVDIVVNNMTELAKQLADRGFSLTNEVVKREPQKSVNQVVDEIIDENAERSIKRYTFDARM